MALPTDWPRYHQRFMAMSSLEMQQVASDSVINAQYAANRKAIGAAFDYPHTLKQQILQKLGQQEIIMQAARHHVDLNGVVGRPYPGPLQGSSGE